MGKRILLFDKSLTDASLNNKVKTDYIYLTNNPYTAINSINKNYDYRLVVIDAGNSDHFISSMIKQATATKMNYVALKRNKSLLLVSND